MGCPGAPRSPVTGVGRVQDVAKYGRGSETARRFPAASRTFLPQIGLGHRLHFGKGTAAVAKIIVNRHSASLSDGAAIVTKKSEAASVARSCLDPARMSPHKSRNGRNANMGLRDFTLFDIVERMRAFIRADWRSHLATSASRTQPTGRAPNGWRPGSRAPASGRATESAWSRRTTLNLSIFTAPSPGSGPFWFRSTGA